MTSSFVKINYLEQINNVIEIEVVVNIYDFLMKY